MRGLWSLSFDHAVWFIRNSINCIKPFSVFSPKMAEKLQMGATTIESGPRYIYILQSFVFSRENYTKSSVLSVLSCYITCITHTCHTN